MSALIRKAGPEDAAAWIDLVEETLGAEHPAKLAFDPDWVERNLSPDSGHETWVAEAHDRLVAAATILFLAPESEGTDVSGGSRDDSFIKNPVCNIGRNLCRADSFTDGSAEALLLRIAEVAGDQNQIAIIRVLASDNTQQIACEKAGFICVGFQPDKHFHRIREEVLFYIKPAQALIDKRLALSDAIPQIAELAAAAMANLHIPVRTGVHDGGHGYPLQTNISCLRVSSDRYNEEKLQARQLNPPREISGGLNTGHGYMRVDVEMPADAFVAERDGRVVGGVHFIFDELDRCVRVLSAFCTDDLSMGAMLHHLVDLSHRELNAFYVEVDVLITAGKLLISTEQLGFVPVAYLPGFHRHADGVVDIVKLVKFNQNFVVEEAELTAQARAVARVVSGCLEARSSGVATVNLLRDLTIFHGLGDGELHKLGRLFTQRLFKACEAVFDRDDAGDEAYVIMRGKVDIFLDEKAQPIATFEPGQVFGELAFLDGSPRGAKAIAARPSILLIIQRSEFFELTQREPHLGLAVMNNIALELGNRLRKMNATLLASSQA